MAQKSLTMGTFYGGPKIRKTKSPRGLIHSVGALFHVHYS